MKNTSKLFSNYSRCIFIKCSDQTRSIRYVWLIWGNSKLVKWTNTFWVIQHFFSWLKSLGEKKFICFKSLVKIITKTIKSIYEGWFPLYFLFLAVNTDHIYFFILQQTFLSPNMNIPVNAPESNYTWEYEPFVLWVQMPEVPAPTKPILIQGPIMEEFN